jgi:signal transduction histidine kinase
VLAAGFTFPLLLHLALAYPSGRLRGAVARALVWVVYLETAIATLGRALFRDPFFDPNCWANCTDNVFLVRSLPHLARGIEVADRWLTAAAAAALVMVLGWRLLRDSWPARRALLPVALPAILLAVTVIAHAIALQRTPLEDPSDPVFGAIFLIGCVGVLLLAAGLVWAAIRTRVQRRAVARIATSLGQAPPPGSLQAALARAVGDPKLQITYWLPDAEHFVDAIGRPVADPVAAPGRAVTTLVRDGRRIAVVSHTAALPDLERELGAGVRLALENERLQAQALAQLDQLRASRVRIVEAGDSERRRLERDLHDGAQQRLLTVSLALHAAERKLHPNDDPNGYPEAAEDLRRASSELAAALAELRELARGIHPAILTDEGLGAALESLADRSPVPVSIDDVPRDRLPPSLESTAYFVVSESLANVVKHGNASRAHVRVACRDRRLEVEIRDDGVGGADMSKGSGLRGLRDRVAAT